MLLERIILWYFCFLRCRNQGTEAQGDWQWSQPGYSNWCDSIPQRKGLNHSSCPEGMWKDCGYALEFTFCKLVDLSDLQLFWLKGENKAFPDIFCRNEEGRARKARSDTDHKVSLSFSLDESYFLGLSFLTGLMKGGRELGRVSVRL